MCAAASASRGKVLSVPARLAPDNANAGGPRNRPRAAEHRGTTAAPRLPARSHSASDTQTSSRSLRTKTQRFAKAGWLQTTSRPKHSLVGSTTCIRPSSS